MSVVDAILISNLSILLIAIFYAIYLNKLFDGVYIRLEHGLNKLYEDEIEEYNNPYDCECDKNCNCRQ